MVTSRAIVGESSSGKSVSALALTQLLPNPPLCQVKGTVRYRSVDLLGLSPKAIRAYRGKAIAYIFQEAGAALNPVFSIGYQIAEAIKLHRPEVKNVKDEGIRLLEQVGIRNAPQRYTAYPHELSGGMQQRIMIAMALACQPRILVADEPTTALDVTIQKQIIELLKTLRTETGMSILMITHNFGIVSGFADRVMVMFQGEIVEKGPTDQLLKHPSHRYTQGLIACVPQMGKRQQRMKTIDYDRSDLHALNIPHAKKLS